MEGEVAVVDYRRCIGCLCCNEVCHFEAIIPWRPAVGRLMGWLADVWKKLMKATH
jgi:Fe-S-cluster-containing hydrogenase component 2